MSKPIHGAPKPVNVPADMREEAPVPCGLAVGDSVTYTNEYGASFERRVRGFASVPHGDRFVYLDNHAWWFPVDPSHIHARSAA
jgi:hypothetical protein